MKILRIGDPHIKPTNLEEAEKLMHFVNDVILERRPDRVELLGDLFHTHSIVRLEVLDFWDSWIDILSEATELYVLIGNHDRATNQEHAVHSLATIKRIRRKNLKIVENPRVDGIFGYISYYHDSQTFIDIANSCVKDGAKVLICHQTFDGSKYESGVYAPDGIDPSKIDCKLIISGHIHTRQIIKNGDQTIIYPGTPKWDTLADANEDKGIWLYEHDDVTGAIISEELIRTAHVVTKLVSLSWVEGEELPAIPSGCKVTIELIGSSEWVNKHKKALKGQFSIKTKITDRVDKAARQAGSSFQDFVQNLYVTNCDREELLKYMKELGLV